MAKRRKAPFWRRQRPSTKIKRKVAKFTGIPTTKSGRKNKLRKILTCGLITLSAVSVMLAALVAAIVSIF